jgi:DNA-binding response OmpR family regulator
MATGDETETVLLVEDDTDLRWLLAEALQDVGYQVLEAETGEMALSLLRERKGQIAWLLTDLHLPGLISGWHVAFEYSFHNPSRPVIYTTGHARQRGHQVHNSIVLRKPFLTGEVVEALRMLRGVSPPTSIEPGWPCVPPPQSSPGDGAEAAA